MSCFFQLDCVKAENCLESLNTLKIVPRCPANRTEWEREAKIKNCSTIHGKNGCQKVEYHCLVNNYRNETIEICSTPRIIQGLYILCINDIFLLMHSV